MKQVFEYMRGANNSHVSILYDDEISRFKAIFSNDADSTFRESFYRVLNRMNNYLTNGIPYNKIILNITKEKDDVVIQIDVVTDSFDIDLYITKDNQLVYRRTDGKSEFVHITPDIAYDIDLIRSKITHVIDNESVDASNLIMVDKPALQT